MATMLPLFLLKIFNFVAQKRYFQVIQQHQENMYKFLSIT